MPVLAHHAFGLDRVKSTQLSFDHLSRERFRSRIQLSCRRRSCRYAGGFVVMARYVDVTLG